MTCCSSRNGNLLQNLFDHFRHGTPSISNGAENQAVLQHRQRHCLDVIRVTKWRPETAALLVMP